MWRGENIKKTGKTARHSQPPRVMRNYPRNYTKSRDVIWNLNVAAEREWDIVPLVMYFSFAPTETKYRLAE